MFREPRSVVGQSVERRRLGEGLGRGANASASWARATFEAHVGPLENRSRLAVTSEGQTPSFSPERTPSAPGKMLEARETNRIPWRMASPRQPLLRAGDQPHRASFRPDPGRGRREVGAQLGGRRRPADGIRSNVFGARRAAKRG